MKNRILIMGNIHDNFIISQNGWIRKQGVIVDKADTLEDARRAISLKSYLAIIIPKNANDLSIIMALQKMKGIPPIVILSPEDIAPDGAKTDADADLHRQTIEPIYHILESKDHDRQDIQIDMDCRTVLVRGQKVQLSCIELDILALLMSRPGIVFTFRQIYAAYGDIEAEPPESSIINSVHCYIRRIRSKLQLKQDSPQYIESVRSVGYRFNI